MTTVDHYKSNLRDILFNLFEANDVARQSLGRAPFGHIDEETARHMLTEFEAFCTTQVAPSFADSDREGANYESGSVRLPESLKKALKAYFDADWHRFEVPEHMGGVGAPPSLIWGAFEMLSGSNPAMAFYAFGSFVARIIDLLATPSQKKRFVQNMIDRHWGGSMVLTEPDAGSDVGQARAKARHVKDDLWEIEGTKRFITNGEFDTAENIVHLVLARPEGAPVGTKGLSMFIVPKFWVDENGKIGERNGVVCTRVEHKMGIRASATCELAFGEDKPARGLLVGEVHDGIRQMFHVIENARMAVGMKSMATLSTAYLNALAYAKERVQGPDLMQALNKAAPRVPIIRHPDVRRMLMEQKCHAEGMRALILYTASVQDRIALAKAAGADKAEMDRLETKNDLLLPLVKGYCSEKAHELLSLSLQCFGGSGFCQDFPIEQYLRDQKIDSLYEGTTHIQALDLFFRKIAKDGGETLRSLLGEAMKTIENAEGGDALKTERELLVKAMDELNGIFQTMMGKVGESLYHVGFTANYILMALSEVVIGWLLIRHAALALAKLPTASAADKAFYAGKIASARYFARTALPSIEHTRRIVESSGLELMELPEEAF